MKDHWSIGSCVARLAIAVAVAGGGLLAVSATAVAHPSAAASEADHGISPVNPAGSAPKAVHLTISAPERLLVNHCYHTPKACLIFQSDGNLVLYDEQGIVRWNSGSWGYTNAYAEFQTDGNLVVYTHSGIPLWNSGTYQSPGATLWVQADGNVVIYDRTGVPVWATHTEH